MKALRYYYSDTISLFLQKSVEEIVGCMTMTSAHDINKKTSLSWVDEIYILQNALFVYKDRGSVYFEYNIPRMGKRVDVVTVIDNIIFVLEFKTEESHFYTRSRDAGVGLCHRLKKFPGRQS